MRFWRICIALTVLGVAISAHADEPLSTTLNEVQGDKSKQPDKEKKVPEPKTNVFAEALVPRTEATRTFNPNMMGDFFGGFARQQITVVGSQTITTPGRLGGNGVLIPPTTVTVPVTQTKTILTPLVGRGAFKIAENASPVPQDRAYFTFNSFNSVRGPFNDAPTSITTTTNTQQTTTIFPAAPLAVANVQREVLGIEKTFLDGNASIELRLPFVQSRGNVDALNTGNVGDLTIIGKYAFILDPTTGDVLSAGLGVTAPTGSSVVTTAGPIHSTLLQPWIGYIWNRDRFFLNAFHSIIVPTDSRDVTLLFNDIGLNYWLLRNDGDRRLRFAVASVETHVTTPLNHRSDDAPIFIPDVVVMTGGVHLGVFRNSMLSLGVATPVTGPTPFKTELFVQFNWYY